MGTLSVTDKIEVGVKYIGTVGHGLSKFCDLLLYQAR